MWTALILVIIVGQVVGLAVTMKEVKRTPESAFAALGSSRERWVWMLWYSAPIAVPLYYFRFRPHLRRAAERATDLPPAWYPDQRDPELERWWDGHGWSDLVRARPSPTGPEV